MVACGTTPKGLLTSLEDITAEVHRQGFIDVNQNRIMSLAGLLAPPHPGRLYRYKDSRAPSTAIGITTTEPSHYIVSTAPIPAGADVLANLATMRGKMLAVRQRAAVTIAARLALAHARRAAENDAASPPLAKVLADKMAAHDTARTAFDSSVDEAMGAIKPGMIVFRWATQSNTSTGLSLGDALSGATTSSRTTSGFAIAYGVRVATLYVGPDVAGVDTAQTSHTYWFEAEFPWILASVKDNDVRLVTHVLQAQHVEWFQDVDIENSIALQLRASANQVGNLADTLSELDRIEIGVVLASLENLGNMGSISGLTRETKTEIFKAGKDFLADNNCWQTIYYVDTDFSDLQDLYRE